LKYPLLFSPGKIGRLTLKNRVVLSPASVVIATLNREFGEDLIAYYEERAKGGAGLLISAAAAVDFVTASGGANQPAISGATFRSMERLARAVHKYEAKMFVQLYHRGKELPSSLIGGRQPVSASELTTKFGDTTHALTKRRDCRFGKKLCRRRPFGAARRVLTRRGARQPRLPAAPVYDPAVQPAHRRIRRQL
jgi:2,4-dienoyl-CoA reductase-like NADH-dependent reductase (Old Yellow Enzyme family)